ncbi:MAG: hypothetical protein JWP36_1751 [Paucimonas sp.]|nr:hypothetical protein [Paucimonas sp.]
MRQMMNRFNARAGAPNRVPGLPEDTPPDRPPEQDPRVREPNPDRTPPVKEPPAHPSSGLGV